jgi:FixJ family two-component response regulator
VPENMIRSWTAADDVNFIQKPFRIDDFIKAIDRVLNSCAERH